MTKYKTSTVMEFLRPNKTRQVYIDLESESRDWAPFLRVSLIRLRNLKPRRQKYQKHQNWQVECSRGRDDFNAQVSVEKTTFRRFRNAYDKVLDILKSNSSPNVSVIRVTEYGIESEAYKFTTDKYRRLNAYMVNLKCRIQGTSHTLPAHLKFQEKS
jgi:hypothetical protein